jgi:hypothetical protein
VTPTIGACPASVSTRLARSIAASRALLAPRTESPIRGDAARLPAAHALKIRLKSKAGGGAHSPAAEVDAVYLAVTPPATALTMTAQAILEAGAWVLGGFKSSGGAANDGSVFLDTPGGSGQLQGGGNFKAFVNLPAGSPTDGTGVFTLGTPSEFG